MGSCSAAAINAKVCNFSVYFTSNYLFSYFFVYIIGLYLLFYIFLYSNDYGDLDALIKSSPLFNVVLALVVGLPPLPSFFIKIGILTIFSKTAALHTIVSLIILFVCVWFKALSSLLAARKEVKNVPEPERAAFVSGNALLVSFVSCFILDFYLVVVCLF